MTSGTHSDHIAPSDVVQHIALNSEKPNITKTEIEDDLREKALRQELDISAIQIGELERKRVSHETFKTHSIKIAPWQERFQRDWPFDPEVLRVGGQIYRTENTTEILCEGLQFIRSQVEFLYPALTVEGRRNRRNVLASCPACISEEEAIAHVRKFTGGAEY